MKIYVIVALRLQITCRVARKAGEGSCDSLTSVFISSDLMLGKTELSGIA